MTNAASAAGSAGEDHALFAQAVNRVTDPTRESKEIVQALNAVAANVSFVEIDSDKGHDAFLLDEPVFHATMTGFINSAAAKRGIAPVRTSGTAPAPASAKVT